MKRSTLLLLSVLLASCRHAPPAEDPAPFAVEGDLVALSGAAAQTTSVVVEPVAPGGEDHITLTGRIVWDEDSTVRIFPPVSGRVVHIATDLGARVTKQACLATLASPDLGQAQADAARAAADLRAAERTLDRERQLLERGAAPRKDVEQAEADLDRARAEHERTQARLALWGGVRPAGRVDQEFALVSPVAGVVVERNLNPGQEVRSDTNAPLFVVSDPRRLWVVLDLTEKDLDITPGAKLTIHTPAYPDRTFPGVLERVGASLDPATRTVHARGRLANPDGALKAEMYVTIDVLKPVAGSGLALPARAVIADGAQRFVFVEEKPGRYRRTAVSVGPEREGRMPIVDGLAASARIVTEGSLLLEAAWADGRKS
jgi:cobalt-zinc-cadmium efflux system membrane fusion protein